MKQLFKGLLLSMLMIPMSFFAQQTLSGTISESATGLPVPGVNVFIKGTTTGTTSDFDGNYSLSGISNENVIVYSFVGFTT
ncbi:MAG: carboxypeptidase-like regulatory domain-containing protein, partial [Flavobacteriaceae bacterium]|nr:carboxypeptidase-like regulatory domain-containing protein [Flavobacteriaceae bacterium]